MGKEQELLDAARNGDVDVVDKILSLRFKKVNSLASLRKLPGPNTRDASGYSSLHFAALNNHKEVVRLLLKHDADPNIKDKKGCTALHLASWAGNYDIVNYILMQSNIEPNVNLVNSDNETPLHSASQFNHHSVVSLLLMHGADISIRNSKDETAFDLACEYGRYETVQVMLDFKPDLVHTSNHLNHTPLHLACKNGHQKVIKLLLSANFDINCITTNGSALHESVFYGRIDIVRLLLDYGIDTLLTNQNGKNVFDLLEQLNTGVSRTIENIIENHALNRNRRHSQSHLNNQFTSHLNNELNNQLNKSTSLHCILPPEQYKDKNQNSIHTTSELVAYVTAEANQSYSQNYSLDYIQPPLQPPKEFAQHPSICSTNYYMDANNKFNSSHRPNRRKVSPISYGIESSKLKNSFSRSQDSVLDDYLITNNPATAQQYDQQATKQHRKKVRPQLSTFVQRSYESTNYDSSSNYESPHYAASKYLKNKNKTNKSDGIYSNLNDEPIYSYPSCNDQQPHSLQNDYLDQYYINSNNENYNKQIQSSLDYHRKSAHNLSNLTNNQSNSNSKHCKQYKPQKKPNNSQSHYQLDYLNSQKMCGSNLNYQKSIYSDRVPSHDSGYSMSTNYETIDPNIKDQFVSNHDSFCENSSFSSSNQCSIANQNSSGAMKRSTSNTSDSYLDNLSISCSSSKDLTSLPVNNNASIVSNYSTLKRYSSVVDELKYNRRSDALTNPTMAAMETVQRFKVVNSNSNDLYAQIDKSRKNSLKGNLNNQMTNQNASKKIQELLDFYDQPSKLVKKVQNHVDNDQKANSSKPFTKSNCKMINHMTSEQLEKNVQSNNRSITADSTNNSIEFTTEPTNTDHVRSQATFVKARLNREKRATIAITLNENELDELQFNKPPSAKMAANQISKILQPIHENYNKMRLRPSKQTMTDEKQFNRFLGGRKMVIIERDIEKNRKPLVDKSTSTEEDKEEGDQIKNKADNNQNNENEKPKTDDLIDLEELNKLEDKFNEIKSSSKDNNQSTTNSTVNSLKPRRQAPPPPPPPPPKHQSTLKPHDTLKSNDKNDTLKSSANESNLNEKILDKIDKDLSIKERDLLTKSLNLPLNLDWKHDPLFLYKQTCHFLVYYLGTNKVKNLQGQGAMESQQCIRDYRKLLNDNNLPGLKVVILSISYKSVRYVDINCQKIIDEHEIRNVHFACQDMDHFRFFAYVTKDADEKGFLSSHVFSACSLEMTSEILMTLAQAFEIAFRLTCGENIDNLRKHYVRSKLKNQFNLNKNNEDSKTSIQQLPKPPNRHSSFSLERNQNLSKSLSESQFNQLLISVSNGFRSSSRNSKSSKDQNKLSLKVADIFKPKQVISASNSIKSIKSVKSENNFLNRRKSLQSTSSQLTSQLNSLNNLNHLNNLVRQTKALPVKPISSKNLNNQTSLTESNFKFNNQLSAFNPTAVSALTSSQSKRAKPQIPEKPLIRRDSINR